MIKRFVHMYCKIDVTTKQGSTLQYKMPKLVALKIEPCVCGNADASKCTLQLNSKKNIFLQIFWCSKHVSSDWKSYFEVYRLIATHPFILHTRFLKFLEIWFEKSGSRKGVLQNWIFFSG